MCQHILAAALTLQRVAQAPVADAPDPHAALRDALAAISGADMQRHAGMAGYRWAWQFVQDLDAENALQESGERNLVLAFAQPHGDGRNLFVARAEHRHRGVRQQFWHAPDMVSMVMGE